MYRVPRYLSEDGSPAEVWHERVFDLTPMAGNTFTQVYFGNDIGGPVGTWSTDFTDCALISADGTVRQIFTGPQGISAWAWGISNMSQAQSGLQTVAATSASTHFYLGDHLGTAQMEFASGGWPVWQGQFAPYGQELHNGSLVAPDQPDPTTANHYKFTGKERDTESGLDYSPHRMYTSTMGRWMSPDPSGLFYADQTNPQSLNLYSYVLNNPLINIDPTGLDCVYIDPDSGQYGGWNAGDCDNSTTDRANAGNYFDGHVTDVNENSNGQVTSYGGYLDNSNGLYTLDTTGFQSSQQSSQFDNPWGDALFAQNGVGAQYFGAANKAVTYGTIGYTAAYSLAFAVPTAIGTLAPNAGFAKIAIGPFLGNPIHFAVGVGESWMHGLGAAGAAGAIPMISQLADRFAGSAFQLSIPVLNTANVLPAEGTMVTNCFTGACAAIGQGWIP